MAKNQNDSFLVIILLIILSILIFVRNGVYLMFDKNFFNLEELIQEPHRKAIDILLSILSFINLFIASIIIYKRNSKHDILTYGLFYIMLSSFLRFYYHYLKVTGKYKNIKMNLNRFQDVNGVLLLFISSYILVNIFSKN